MPARVWLRRCLLMQCRLFRAGLPVLSESCFAYRCFRRFGSIAPTVTPRPKQFHLAWGDRPRVKRPGERTEGNRTVGPTRIMAVRRFSLRTRPALAKNTRIGNHKHLGGSMLAIAFGLLMLLSACSS